MQLLQLWVRRGGLSTTTPTITSSTVTITTTTPAPITTLASQVVFNFEKNRTSSRGGNKFVYIAEGAKMVSG